MNLNRGFVVGVLIILILAMLPKAILRLPAPLLLLIGLGISGWLMFIGWRSRSGAGTFAGPGTKPRVQYWRGQRIELEPEKPAPLSLASWRQYLPYIYMAIGLISAILIIARFAGMR